MLAGGDVEMTASSGNAGFNVVADNVANETSVYVGGGLLIGGGENTILKTSAPGGRLAVCVQCERSKGQRAQHVVGEW